MRPITALLLLGTLCVTSSGCAAVGERAAAAEAAATQFEAALRGGDVRRACEALAPGTREELEQDGPCGTALGTLNLTPAAAPAVRVDAYGSQARVVFPRDTVFLAAYPDGWKVTAAGCVPRPGRPHRCELKGD
ncbi:hypothetical protein MTF65_03525 [Streptomyces sp. APSN-46.1]|uniref:hypothetical protein n=1 Tax=Streptomyces sp. APSN-46.1 TaxID=2929049 RepID=UPI001FB556F2|nr:hypothetical protein [Streptomyces sp. APSN-46.1]MCJ1676434.1 hypothetical protein [Streptomyces sp. APSN-46.1]